MQFCFKRKKSETKKIFLNVKVTYFSTKLRTCSAMTLLLEKE